MAGEMSRADLTREAFPLHFLAADQVPGATVKPFDVYQGPYVFVPSKGRFWLICDEDSPNARWWSERYGEYSAEFWCDLNDDVPARAFKELVSRLG